MDAIAPRGFGGGEQGGLVKVAVRGLSRSNAEGLGGQLDMEGLLIRLGIDGYGFNTRLPAGPEDAQGDLSPVGDEHPLQHG